MDCDDGEDDEDEEELTNLRWSLEWNKKKGRTEVADQISKDIMELKAKKEAARAAAKVVGDDGEVGGEWQREHQGPTVYAEATLGPLLDAKPRPEAQRRPEWRCAERDERAVGTREVSHRPARKNQLRRAALTAAVAAASQAQPVRHKEEARWQTARRFSAG